MEEKKWFLSDEIKQRFIEKHSGENNVHSISVYWDNKLFYTITGLCEYIKMTMPNFYYHINKGNFILNEKAGEISKHGNLIKELTIKGAIEDYQDKALKEIVDGKMMCGTCHQLKPVEAFPTNPGKRLGYADMCRQCHTEKYYKRHPRQIKPKIPKPPRGAHNRMKLYYNNQVFESIKDFCTKNNMADSQFHRFEHSGDIVRIARTESKSFDLVIKLPIEQIARQSLKQIIDGKFLCGRCNLWKPTECFSKDLKNDHSLSNICRDCCREWRKNNWNTIKNGKLKSAYNITLENYNKIFKDQNGLCASCGCVESDSIKGRFHVDHDHETGVVRSLLCGQCNTILGLAEESKERLDQIKKYLDKMKPTNPPSKVL